tara:strand:- start:134 stop:499 length:366 start_codon:yes stop_codon:yes gene_type:complete
MNGQALFVVEGTLVADPEVIEMGDDKKLVKIRLAWNEKRKGEQTSSFANFESWNPYKNDIIEKYCKKGKNISVRGTFVEDSYENKNGDKVKTYRFRVEDFQLLDNRNDSSGSSSKEEDVPF